MLAWSITWWPAPPAPESVPVSENGLPNVVAVDAFTITNFSGIRLVTKVRSTPSEVPAELVATMRKW